MSAQALPAALAEVLARGDIWRGDSLAHLPQPAIPSGYAELDAELPGGGWPRACLSEFLSATDGIGELSLLMPALARLSASGGWLALVAPPFLPHAPAWAAAGIALERLLILRPAAENAWCTEQLLASGGFAAVLAWPEKPGRILDARTLRRWQVAAEGGPALACLWRSPAAAQAASPAPLRLGLSAQAGQLAIRLLKRRGAPARRSLQLPLPLTVHGNLCRALARPAFPLPADRSPVDHEHAMCAGDAWAHRSA